MAETPQSWQSKEEITSTKANSITSTLMTNIVNNEGDISDILSYLGQIIPIVAGGGVYQKENNNLKVSHSSGLTISIAAGQCLINGAWLNVPTVSNIVLNSSTTSHVYIDDTGDISSTTGTIPSNAIPLADVVTDASTVTGITDTRIDLVDATELVVARADFASLNARLDDIESRITTLEGGV